MLVLVAAEYKVEGTGDFAVMGGCWTEGIGLAVKAMSGCWGEGIQLTVEAMGGYCVERTRVLAAICEYWTGINAVSVATAECWAKGSGLTAVAMAE